MKTNTTIKTKVKVIAQYQQLAGILDIDDEVELIAPAGSYKGYKFKSKNGKTYSDRMLLAQIGYVSIEKIFAKV